MINFGSLDLCRIQVLHGMISMGYAEKNHPTNIHFSLEIPSLNSFYLPSKMNYSKKLSAYSPHRYY